MYIFLNRQKILKKGFFYENCLSVVDKFTFNFICYNLSSRLDIILYNIILIFIV